MINISLAVIGTYFHLQNVAFSIFLEFLINISLAVIGAYFHLQNVAFSNFKQFILITGVQHPCRLPWQGREHL